MASYLKCVVFFLTLACLLDKSQSTPILQPSKPFVLGLMKTELPLEIQKVVRTYYKTSTTQVTSFSTCTTVAPGTLPCQYNQRARTKRQLISLPVNHVPHYPKPSKVQLNDEYDIEPEVELPAYSMIPEFSTPQHKLIIVRLKSTVTTYITNTLQNGDITVAITYDGCVPSDAIEAPTCPRS